MNIPVTVVLNIPESHIHCPCPRMKQFWFTWQHRPSWQPSYSVTLQKEITVTLAVSLLSIQFLWHKKIQVMIFFQLLQITMSVDTSRSKQKNSFMLSNQFYNLASPLYCVTSFVPLSAVKMTHNDRVRRLNSCTALQNVYMLRRCRATTKSLSDRGSELKLVFFKAQLLGQRANVCLWRGLIHLQILRQCEYEAKEQTALDDGSLLASM